MFCVQRKQSLPKERNAMMVAWENSDECVFESGADTFAREHMHICHAYIVTRNSEQFNFLFDYSKCIKHSRLFW